MKVGRFLRRFLLIRLIHVTCVPRLHTHGLWEVMKCSITPIVLCHEAT